ncbi:MAG: tRNA (adenosine(37)-N6)-threonylcarbamoyltransferase complex ATPase subunit type 1 TsaE [Clostridia bacterium]|nr:tRNA (adenosine(37)-N6)-threonylcarbamoyltransferase complex ATPase subunit type 1 TsaE [Clostridia bacterium]
MALTTRTCLTADVARTEALGEALGRGIGPCTIALTGGLGAGKTAFVRGLARGLGYTGEVSSPTFAIVHEYEGGRLPLIHFDMYRITGWDDLESTGYFDYQRRPAVLAIEWSENVEGALPAARLTVAVERGEKDNERRITLTASGGISLEDLGC